MYTKITLHIKQTLQVPANYVAIIRDIQYESYIQYKYKIKL
jgi:hypothetical protein